MSWQVYSHFDDAKKPQPYSYNEYCDNETSDWYDSSAKKDISCVGEADRKAFHVNDNDRIGTVIAAPLTICKKYTVLGPHSGR